MSQSRDDDHLVSFRRDIHQYPELAWREFYTTYRIAKRLEEAGVDEIHMGREAIAEDHRSSVPPEDEIERAYERALEYGAEEALLRPMRGGFTGLIAEVQTGPGPTIGVWADIDALEQSESETADHEPAVNGFRSEHDGVMHACGHDANTAIAVGITERIVNSDFGGTLKVFFEPAEEVGAGGKPMAKSGHLSDVEYLLALHVGLDHPTGEIVAGLEGFLATMSWSAAFSGESAHAGVEPNAGKSTIQAAATAVTNLQAIPRHADGVTRVNVGEIHGGTATNVIPQQASLDGEVRGETQELREYMWEHAERILQSAGRLHDCTVEIETDGEVPEVKSDPTLRDVVAETAKESEGVESVQEKDWVGASTDAAYLLKEVQENGGVATYVGVGSDHPTGHHTSTFDIDEKAIGIGADVLSDVILAIDADEPVSANQP